MMREGKPARLARLVWPLILALGLTFVLLWGLMPRLGAQAQAVSASTGDAPSVVPRPGIPLPLPNMPAAVRHDLWHLSLYPQSVGRFVKSPYVTPVGQSVRLPYATQSGPLAQSAGEPARPARDQSLGSSYAGSGLPPPYRPVSRPPQSSVLQPAPSTLFRTSPTVGPPQVELVRSKPVTPPAVAGEPVLPPTDSLIAEDGRGRAMSLPLSTDVAGYSLAEAVSPLGREALAALTPPMPGAADLAICLDSQRVWGVVGAGENVTVTVNGVQMGACWADGKGFFWTTLYDGTGHRPGLAAGDVVAIYHNGALAANVTLRSIVGQIDLLADSVSGTIGGVGHPLSVTVYTPMAEPSPTSYQLAVNTDVGGNFTADMSALWEFGAQDEAQVAYVEGAVEVHKHVYPAHSLEVRGYPYNWAFGFGPSGFSVAATLYASDCVTVKASDTFPIQQGFYFWAPPADIVAGDVVEIDFMDGTVVSRTMQVLTEDVDAVNNRITGTTAPGVAVRGVVNNLTAQGGWVMQTEAVADGTSGAYTLDFAGLADIQPGYAPMVRIADAEGDDQSLRAPVPYVDVNQTWNTVEGRGVYMPGPIVEGQPVTMTLRQAASEETSEYYTTMDWNGWYSFGATKEDPLPDIVPGDTVTVTTSVWQGVVPVREMTVQHDLLADQFTGTVEPPSSRVEVTGWHWATQHYPLAGQFELVTTASSAWAVAPTGFDVNNSTFYEVAHRTADEYVERIYNEADSFGVIIPKNRVLVKLSPPGTAFTVTLYDGQSMQKTQMTGMSGEPIGNAEVSFDDAGVRVAFSDRVQVESAAGFSQTLVIPELVLQGDDASDLVYGRAPANMRVGVSVGGQGEGAVPTRADGSFAVALDQLQSFYGNGDLKRGDYADLECHDENKNWLYTEILWPHVRVNYAHDWVGGDYWAGHTFWITVTDGSAVVKATAEVPSTPGGGWGTDGFETGDGWSPEHPDIQPGDWVYVQGDDGFYREVRVGNITGALDVANDSVGGEVYAEWFSDTLAVRADIWECCGAPTKDSTAAPDGSVPYFCQWDPATEWDLQPGQNVAVMYYEPDGDSVINVFRQPRLDLIMDINYAHDWVEGNYEEVGHTLWLTVTESDGVTIKATATMLTQVIPWWNGGTGFSTNVDDPWVPARPDMQPGDWLYGAIDNGYTGTVRIGTITGALDVDADTISGTVNAPWFTEMLNGGCGVWVQDGPSTGFQVDSNGGTYFCDFGAMGWDLLPGQDVGVNYQEPDGDQVYNVFREPAPDLRLEKWVEGNEAAPGGSAVFTIRYRNEGDAVAETIWLTDTLPANTSYVADSSGEPADVGPGYVSWTLGPLDPDEERRFQVVLSNTAGPSDTLRNVVDGWTLYDYDPGDEHAESEVHVGEGQPDLWVNKWVSPSDPAPGQTFVYHVDYGNNGPVASGAATLTETLPMSTTLVSWRSDNAYDLWAQVSYDGNQLVLVAAAIPGNWSDTILVRLEVNADVPVGTQLVNEVEIQTAGDADGGNNWHRHDGAWVGEPRWDAAVWKDFGWARAVPGGEVQYWVGFNNNGNMPARAWLTDTLPAGTSPGEMSLSGPVYQPFPPDYVGDGVVAWDLGLIEPGEGLGINLKLDIAGDVEPGTVLTNCVQVSIDGEDGDPGNDQACVYSAVAEPGPNLRVEKRYWWQGDGQLRYEIGVVNVGTEDLYDFEVTDTYPELTAWHGDWWWNRWEWGDVQVAHDELSRRLVFSIERIGQQEPVWLNFRVDLDGDVVGKPGMAFTNTVEASIPGDVYPDDNYHQVVAYSREPAPDLYVEKWVEGNEAAPGGMAVFGISCRNDGELPADPVWLTDTLPADTAYVADSSGVAPTIGDGWVSWTLGPLNPGEEKLFLLALSNTAAPSDTLRNVVDGWTLYDYDPGDEHAESEIHVGEGQPDLWVNKWVSPSDPAPGQTFVYHVDYGNNGPVASGAATLTETLPMSTTLVSWRSDNAYDLWAQVSYDGNQLVLVAAAIPGNWSDTILLRLQVNADVPVGTQLVNEVEIQTAGDADGGNNWHSHDGAWVGEPRWDGGVWKDFLWARAVPGGQVQYWIKFNNEGNMAARAWLTDTLPAGTSPSDMSLSGPVYQPFPPDFVGDGVVAWDLGVIEPGEQVGINLKLDIAGNLEPGTVLTNCVQVSIDGEDGDPGNDQACVHSAVAEPGPNVRVEKHCLWEGDGQLRYEVGVWNVGTEDLYDVEVTDTYPELTGWHGDWWWNRWGWGDVQVTHDEPNGQLVFWIERIGQQEPVWLNFRVDLDGDVVGKPDMAFTNTVEAPIPGDVYPDDNYHQVVAFSREPAPDVHAQKWYEGNEAAPGGMAVFGIRCRNDGELPADPVWLTDTLPVGTAYVADSSGLVPTLGDGWVSWDVGGLNPGEERVFLLALSNTASPSDTLHNVLDAGTPVDRDWGNNHAESDHHVGEGGPDLWASKWVRPDDPAPGQTFIYAVNYGNNAPVASGPVAMTDTLPAATQLVSWHSSSGYGLWQASIIGNQIVWTAPSIPGNWSDTLWLRLRVDEGTPVGTQLVNEVQIQTEGDTDPNNDQYVHSDTKVGDPHWDAAIYKGFEWGQLVAGRDIAYSLSFVNSGNMPAPVWITDTLSPGTSLTGATLRLLDLGAARMPDWMEGQVAVWDLGVLEPGTEGQLEIYVHIQEETPPGAILVNCAELGMDGPDGYPDDNTSCTEDRVNEPGPNLRVFKSYWWENDGRLGYWIRYENVGTEWLGNIQFVDTYPLSTAWNGDYWTWNYGVNVTHDPDNRQVVFELDGLDEGDRGGFGLRVDLDPSVVGKGGMAFTNTVEVPIPGDVYPDDNFDQVVAYSREPAPDLYVEKWYEGNEAAPGGMAVFGIRCRNDGELPADPVWLTDTLPSGTAYVADSSGVAPTVGDGWVSWDVGVLNPGEERVFLLALSNTASPSDTLRNVVDAYTPVDDDWGNNHAESDHHVGEGGPDLWANKWASPSDPTPGQTFLYVINYGNNNPVASGPVALTDTLPGGIHFESWVSSSGYTLWEMNVVGNQLVWTAPALPGSWSDMLYVRLRVDESLPIGTQLINEVEIQTAGDTDPGNNHHTHDSLSVGEPHWEAYIDKSTDWGVLVPLGEVVYSVGFGNMGNMPAQFWITDTLPAGTSIFDCWLSTESVWTHRMPDSVDGQVAVWDMGILEPGTQGFLEVHVAVFDTVPPGTVLENCAEIRLDGPEDDPADNTSCTYDRVNEPGPNLRLRKQFWWNGEAQLGYWIRYENVGTERLENIQFVDTYPLWTAWNGGMWTWNYGLDVTHDPGNRQILLQLAELNPGERGGFGLWIDLDPSVVGMAGMSFTNTVAAPIAGDVYPDDNYDEVVASTAPPPTLLRFDPPDTTVRECVQSFTVDAYLEDVANLGGFEFTVLFDPAVVQVEDIALASFITESGRLFLAVPPQIDNAAGTAAFAGGVFGPGPDLIGSGPIATITFSPAGAGASGLLWQSVQVTDPNGDAIPFVTRDVVVTVLAALPGDMDCDCDVDIVDIMLVASRWNTRVGDPRYDPHYDIDGDGDIDIVDIMRVASRWNTHCEDGFAPQPRRARVGGEFADETPPEGVRITRRPKGVLRDETYVVEITVDGVADLGGFELLLRFDPKQVQVEGVELGELLGSTGRTAVALEPAVDNQVGTVRFAAFSYGAARGADGSGVLARVTLRALTTSGGKLTVSRLQLTDTQGREQ